MRISLVVPVFNESEVVQTFYAAVQQDAALRQHEVEIVFINDGSRDDTEAQVRALIQRDASVQLINFSRNFGKEAALFAGLTYATGDVIVPMDVDLQDPVEVIGEMLAKHQAGADVVLAKRANRDSDSKLKRLSAKYFYRIHNRLSSPKIEENAGDFRLMSRRVVDAVVAMPERQLFMKGVLSWVGFKTDVVTYRRPERVAGVSKFNGWKLWNLALEGVTSFSTVPLRVWSYLGASIALLSFLYAVYVMLDKLVYGNPVSGYASLMVVMLFLGGVQLIGIGVLGEYLGRVYMEAKGRPRYIVRDAVGGRRAHD